jgi:superfamily II DNA or RNA helicase
MKATSFEPREYQLRAARECYRELILKGHSAVLLVASTGSGKTVIGSFFIRKMIELMQWHVNFFAHRREIIQQTAGKLTQAGLWPGIVMAGEHPAPGRQVQVCSIQTYLSWVRRGKHTTQRPDLVIVDEAHTSMSDMYRSLIEQMIADGVKVLGMTATPIGTGGRGLGNLYTAMVRTPSYLELAAMGYLVLPQYFVGIIPDVSGVKLVNDDYGQRELNAVLDNEKLIGDVVDNWGTHSRGRSTVCFAAGVPHSMSLAAKFRAAGVRAVHIDGETDKGVRDQANEDLGAGRIDMICNYGTHVEGTDIPRVSCIIDAKPTKSLARYLQSGGRGSRPHVESGKTDFNYHDHSGNVNRHGRLELNRQWILCTGTENQSMNDAAMKDAKVERVCPGCGCLFNGTRCPVCDEPYVRQPEDMDFLPADLMAMTNDELDAQCKAKKHALEAAEQQQSERQWFAEALTWCVSTGKKPGFAAYAFEAKFKHFPPRGWENLRATPGSAVTGYMEHRIIRAAKGKAAAAIRMRGRG